MKKINKLVLSLMVLFILLVLNTTVVNASSTKISAPKNVKVSVSGVKNAKVKWSKVSGAKKYTIYRATSKKGKYKKVGTSKTNSFVNKDLARGKTYFYKVVANGASSNSKKSSYVKVKILTKSQVLKKIRNALKDKTWVKNNVKMKDVNGRVLDSKQVLYFGKLKNKELVAVEALADYSVQMFIVGYKNGKIVSSPSSDILHPFHGGPSIDLNTGMASAFSLNHGYTFWQISKVSGVKFKILDTFRDDEGAMSDKATFELNGKKISKKKYTSASKKYNKYNFISLSYNGYKLTNSNIDKYIK